MALQGKHSRNGGAVPNLIPGEFGSNLADAILWLRGQGTKIGLDLQAVIARAAPDTGPLGAPIRFVGGEYVFDDNIAPSSVVDSVVNVDPSPIGGLGVPGVFLASTTSTTTLETNDILICPFYIASDSLAIKSLNINATTTPSGAIRLGILSPDGTVQADYSLPSIVLGPNGHDPTHPLVLTRGFYYLVLWTAAPLTVTTIQGHHPDQGWTYSGTAPSFQALGTANQDLSEALALPTIAWTMSATPGEAHSIFAGW